MKPGCSGLSCAVAIPIFAGDDLKAVVGLFFGRDADDSVGAIELGTMTPTNPMNCRW